MIRRGLAPTLVLLAALVAGYGSALPGPFLFDDRVAVVENESLRDLLSPAVLAAPDDTPLAGRPVANLSFAFDRALWGLDPRGYRATTLLVHLVAALALFGLLRRSLPEWSTGWSLAVATVWLVHPLHSEVVNYVTQRTGVLAGAAVLVALYAARRSADEPARSRRWAGLAVGAAFVGVGSKEVAALVPLLVVLSDWTFLAAQEPGVLRRRRPLYLALALSWLPLAALLLLWPRAETLGFGTGVGPVVYLANQAPVVLGYLRAALWPWPVVFDYGPPSPVGLADVWLEVALLLGLAAVAVGLLLRRRPAGFAAVAAMLLLAPTSSILPIATEVGAERRTYLPLAAVAVLGVGLLRSVRPPLRRAVPALLVGIVVLELAVLQTRNRIYDDPVRLWRSVTETRPANPRGWNNLGVELADRGDPVAGRACFRRALDLEPAYPGALLNLGNALRTEGRPKEAIRALERAVALDPGLPEAHNNLGAALAEAGRLQAALEAFDRALVLAPDYPEARRNRALAVELLEGVKPPQ